MVNFPICTHACVRLAAAPEKQRMLSLCLSRPGSLCAPMFQAVFTTLFTAHRYSAQNGLIAVLKKRRNKVKHIKLCHRALTVRRCENLENNELSQGYLRVSPCHCYVSASDNLIRWGKLLKMFSDSPPLLLLCPQTYFTSLWQQEMISAFSSHKWWLWKQRAFQLHWKPSPAFKYMCCGLHFQYIVKLFKSTEQIWPPRKNGK